MRDRRENLPGTIVFFVGLILSASGLLSPPVALAAGLLFGLTLSHPYPAQAKRMSRFLLQASVVGLGFGMNLHEVIHAGRSGIVYAALSITITMLLGLALGRAAHVEKVAAFLISAGTAICGGSAIAAVGPIAQASDEQMAVSLGAVFILNSVALLTFPTIGWALHLSETQFGLWSALAIHDTSSVVGATAKYGSVALAVGTTVKLARALWIVPLALLTALAKRSNARVQWPWFILFFCLAALATTYWPSFGSVYALLNHLGRLGLMATLYLIGTGLSRKTIRQVGVRPLILALTLWIVVALTSLQLIRTNWIHL